jgi:hypothetical protein
MSWSFQAARTCGKHALGLLYLDALFTILMDKARDVYR